MQWSDLLGHQRQQQWFRRALESNRLATSFLFIGPAGIGKRTFAQLLAKSLLCRNSGTAVLAPCGACEDCAQVEAGTHPDLITVSKPPDKSFLPIELLIGRDEKRMREGLCHDISLKPYTGRRKIAIVDDADYFNVEGANCLLKTLEEPPLDSLMILIGTSLQRQLPTIRSRCQAILFQPLAQAEMRTLLLREGLCDSEQAADRLAQRSGGNLAEARLLVDSDVDDFHQSLLNLLAGSRLPLVQLAKECGGIVDAAGKDGRLKRERMKLVFRFASAFYRQLALRLASPEHPAEAADERLLTAVEQARRTWKSGPRGAAAAWNRCLQAMEQVDRNANQATLLETWSSDLAMLGEY